MALPRQQLAVLFAALLGAVALLAYPSAGKTEPAGGAVDHAPAGAPYAAGELLVTYEEEVAEEAVESLDEEAEVEEEIPEIDAKLLEFPELKNERSREVREEELARAKEELEKDPAVESVDYNFLLTVSFTPNDPGFDEQWGLSTPRFTRAWNRTQGLGARVGVVDSGARHPELRDKIVARHDFVNNDSTVEDPLGHGTHVAGTVAADTDNGTGVAGGCPGCKLVVAKAVGSDGYGSTSDIAESIVWSADEGAEVINLSLGGSASPTLENAVDYAVDRGAVVVAAVGNDGSSIKRYPAAYPDVMAVAATDRYNQRASFSNYGSWLDVAAPGVDILSTASYGEYRFYSGTSMAAPHVSALAGLLVGQGHGPSGVRSRILDTAVDLGPDGHDPYFGAGRIRAGRAVR